MKVRFSLFYNMYPLYFSMQIFIHGIFPIFLDTYQIRITSATIERMPIKCYGTKGIYFHLFLVVYFNILPHSLPCICTDTRRAKGY